MRGFSELMEHRLEQPKFREQAELIRKAAEYLNTLLGQILDLAKVESGAMALADVPVDLRALVRGTADFFALSAADKGLVLAVAIDPEVPESVVCDPLRLKQILNNLLSNAIKFTAEGRVDVVVERVGERVLVHVEDTGCGIAPELHETVFERFRRGPRARQLRTRRHRPGAGAVAGAGRADGRRADAGLRARPRHALDADAAAGCRALSSAGGNGRARRPRRSSRGHRVARVGCPIADRRGHHRFARPPRRSSRDNRVSPPPTTAPKTSRPACQPEGGAAPHPRPHLPRPARLEHGVDAARALVPGKGGHRARVAELAGSVLDGVEDGQPLPPSNPVV
ncbi:MAG: HAMP domain-containing histidine kinase [Comamonadaceae bacterium]|nr:HAMP domain-containing histidine kinase [Comamonadaceae bacterium]